MDESEGAWVSNQIRPRTHLSVSNLYKSISCMQLDRLCGVTRSDACHVACCIVRSAMKRKGSVTAAPSCSSSAIALPPGAAQSKTYVEFHASMSLDNPTSALSFFAPSSSSSSSNASRAALSSHQQQLNASSPAKYEHTTLEEILKQRFRVWSQVHEVIVPFCL